MEIQDKTLLITGGTGSLGNAVLNRFLQTDHFSEIRIFSKDNQYYITQNFFEPDHPDKDWISSFLKKIEIAFRWHKPAIISS